MGGSPMPLGPGIPPPQNQQLPPQMFTTAAQLLDLTDSKISDFQSTWGVETPHLRLRKHLNIEMLESRSEDTHQELLAEENITDPFASSEKLLVSLRDGRKLIGVLRSWDQFGTSPAYTFTLFLEHTIDSSPSKSSPPIHNRTGLRPTTDHILSSLYSNETRPLRRYSSRDLPRPRGERTTPGRDRPRQRRRPTAWI